MFHGSPCVSLALLTNPPRAKGWIPTAGSPHLGAFYAQHPEIRAKVKSAGGLNKFCGMTQDVELWEGGCRTAGGNPITLMRGGGNAAEAVDRMKDLIMQSLYQFRYPIQYESPATTSMMMN